MRTQIIRINILLLSCLLIACSSPKDTPIPKDLEKMESIKESMKKLTPEERDLVTSYIMRHTIGAQIAAAFGDGDKKPEGIPDGMTIGKAIAEQRKFKAEKEAEEAKQKALKEKLQAEKDKASKAMRDAVTVTLVSKKLEAETGYSGIKLDENIKIVVGYKNNTSKDISGVKGTLDVKDVFGEELSGFNISNDMTIKAGGTATWVGSRSTRFGMNSNNDRKFADLPEGKYTIEWHPAMIVFADGSKMTLPDD